MPISSHISEPIIPMCESTNAAIAIATLAAMEVVVVPDMTIVDAISPCEGVDKGFQERKKTMNTASIGRKSAAQM